MNSDSPPRLLDLYTSTYNNLFVKYLYFSIRNTQPMISNIGRCRLPPLITTPRYALTKTTYWRPSTPAHAIISLIRTHLVNSTRLQPAPCQLYQSTPPYHGYQRGNEKGIYQVHDEDSDPHPEDFHTTLEKKGLEVEYLDEGFD